MGAINEKPIWADEIYRIQFNDPIVGGEDGIVNVQPAQLANRTLWLREALEKEHDDSGLHHVTDDQVAPDAGILESKLDLDVPLKKLRNDVDYIATYVSDMHDATKAVIGDEGYVVQGLARTVSLNWKYADFGWEFEFFTDTLTMRDFADIDVTGAVAGDDSLNCSSTNGLSPGMRLRLFDGEKSEEVEIWQILERGRVRTVDSITNTYADGLTKLGYTDWSISDGVATARKGRTYYSKVTTILGTSPMGHLLIRRDSGSGELTVQYRVSADAELWQTAERTNVLVSEDGEWYDEFYDIDGGYVQLKIWTDNMPVVVEHMALWSAPTRQVAGSIRTPKVLSPGEHEDVYRDSAVLSCSIFRCMYGDNFVETEYRLRDHAGIIRKTVTTEMQEPIDSLTPSELPEDGPYTISCRQKSDIGEWSEWSQEIPITLRAISQMFGFKGTAKATGFDVSRMDSLASRKIRFGFEGAESSAGFGAALFTVQLED